MNKEEIKKELMTKLPAEIVEKIESKTLTEDDIKQYIQPLYEQYSKEIEGFAPLSDEELENVNGGSGILDKIGCGLAFIFDREDYNDCLNQIDNQRKLKEAGRRSGLLGLH